MPAGFTYSSEIRSDVDRVRLRIQDTDISDSATWKFMDAEITEFLSANDNSVLRASAAAARSWAATPKNSAVEFQVFEGLRLKQTEVSKFWLTLAEKWERQANEEEEAAAEFIDSTSYERGLYGGDATEWVG